MFPGNLKKFVDSINLLKQKLLEALLLVHQSIMLSYHIIRYSPGKHGETGGWKGCFKQFKISALPWPASIMMGKEKSGADGGSTTSDSSGSIHSDMSFIWPGAAVPAIAALEKAAASILNNAVLAQLLLSGELEPSQILNMSPNELEEGVTAEEIASLKRRGTCRLFSVVLSDDRVD
ncbi:Chromatin remodeling protein like [Forsythia ovata]|uniref:Chromatin remodeling protein like n=1 Tax=Forsythia ovata TaxID=205694 RepID=A0ABD1W391_9LAMI